MMTELPSKIFRNDVVIHLGYHKTGSTFLQKSLFPKLGANLCSSQNFRYLVDSTKIELTPFILSVADRSVETGSELTVYSQEGLSGGMMSERREVSTKIAKHLQSLFPSARILIVVREQFDMLKSIYLHQVRELEPRSFKNFIGKFEEDLQNKLQYHRLINTYIDLFGSENVLVLPFEQLVSAPGIFQQSVCDFVGTHPHDEVRRSVINPGLNNQLECQLNRLVNYPLGLVAKSWEAVVPLHTGKRPLARRSISKIKYRTTNPMIGWISKNSRSEVILPEEWRGKLSPHFKQSNRILAKTTAVPLEKYGYCL